jgi:AAA15 family ATPase/GTPase
MVATREEQHADHILRVSRYNLKLLPIAAVYGANASGKSNLTKALSFAEKFVTNPPKPDVPIPVTPFLLNSSARKRPTTFRFDLLIEGTIYRYTFSVSSKKVVHEELIHILPTREEPLFSRGPRANHLHLSDKLRRNAELQFAFRGTQENQLFVTNSVSQKLEEFKPIFDWFAKSLTVINPTSRYGRLPEIVGKKHPLASQITKRLRNLDSGIHSLRQIEISGEDVLPRELMETIASSMKDGETFWLSEIGGLEGDFLDLKGGKATIKRLTPIHQAEGGKNVAFRFSDESDGTRRILDLLPAFIYLDLGRYPFTFVIDELNRSLHANLTRSLIDHFLSHRSASSGGQLIFTTHDTELMSQSVFRRDELWVTERDRGGGSGLTSFSEFKDVRRDKNIRKSYLQGRMGGVPRIRTDVGRCEEEVKRP